MTRIDPAAARLRARLRADCAEQDRQLRAAAAAARMEPPRPPGPVTPPQWPDAPWGRCAACKGTKKQHVDLDHTTAAVIDCMGCSFPSNNYAPTGRALPADRERNLLAMLAEMWAAGGKGPSEGMGTCRWCRGEGYIKYGRDIHDGKKSCRRCTRWIGGDAPNNVVRGQRPARNLAPVAARHLLDAVRRAPAHPVHAALLAEAVRDVGTGPWAWAAAVSAAAACGMLLADLSGGAYTARPERDLPALRLLVALQGEAGEVLRQLGQGEIVPADDLTLDGWASILSLFHGRPGGGQCEASPRGLAIARALWGGCPRVQGDFPLLDGTTTVNEARAGLELPPLTERCTLVAGHAAGCRWEGGDDDSFFGDSHPTPLNPGDFSNLLDEPQPLTYDNLRAVLDRLWRPPR
jgi:hypothetical protein